MYYGASPLYLFFLQYLFSIYSRILLIFKRKKKTERKKEEENNPNFLNIKPTMTFCYFSALTCIRISNVSIRPIKSFLFDTWNNPRMGLESLKC